MKTLFEGSCSEIGRSFQKYRLINVRPNVLMYGCFFGSEDHWEEVDARRHALWWLWRPILDLQALEQDGHVNVVSVTGWLTES